MRSIQIAVNKLLLFFFFFSFSCVNFFFHRIKFFIDFSYLTQKGILKKNARSFSEIRNIICRGGIRGAVRRSMGHFVYQFLPEALAVQLDYSNFTYASHQNCLTLLEPTPGPTCPISVQSWSNSIQHVATTLERMNFCK
jgi:hypothetical protein